MRAYGKVNSICAICVWVLVLAFVKVFARTFTILWGLFTYSSVWLLFVASYCQFLFISFSVLSHHQSCLPAIYHFTFNCIDNFFFVCTKFGSAFNVIVFAQINAFDFHSNGFCLNKFRTSFLLQIQQLHGYQSNDMI